MPLSKKFLLWTAAALAAVAVFGVGVFIIYLRLAVGGPGEVTAKYIPSDAPLYVSLNLRPGLSQIRKAQKVISTLETEEVVERRDEFLDNLEDETGIHFLDDVTPWLGTHVSAAVLDADLDRPEWVAMVQISDRKAAGEFLEALVDYAEDNRLADFHQDDDEGVAYWVDSYISLAIALTDEYMLIGDSRDTVEDIANYFDSPPSEPLMDDESFIAARRMAADPRTAFVFARTEDLVTDMLSLGNELGILPLQIEDVIPEVVVVSSSFVDNGVRLDLAYAPPQDPAEPADPVLITSHEVLPADTLLMLGSTGLADVWETTTDSIEDIDPFMADEFDDLLAQIEDEFGVDIERDVIDALSGEMALALLPSEVNSRILSGEGGFDWTLEMLLLAGLKNPDSIENALDVLVDELEESGIEVDRDSLGKYEAVKIRLDEGLLFDTDYEPGYVVTEEWLAGGSTSESLELFHQTLSGETDSLGSVKRFGQIFDMASEPIQFLLYADVSGLLNMLEDALPSDTRRSYRRDVRPFVENLSVFMLTGSTTADEARITAVLTVGE